MKKKKSKYAYYEASVQTPEQHAAMFSLIYADIRGTSPTVLREDFCGTFAISCEWIKRNPKNKALCIDLDNEPLAYGKKHRLRKLSTQQKKQIHLLQQSVISKTNPKADVAIACNFSFNIFKEREVLLRYLKAVMASLKPGGLVILEMAGGPGMIEKTKDRLTIDDEDVGKFTYIWDQKTFNPITHHVLYSIHFKFPDGSVMEDAFVYDWRLWTIPEMRDILKEAGFSRTHTYWEIEKNGKGTGEYARSAKADNAYSWIAYVVGEKPARK